MQERLAICQACEHRLGVACGRLQVNLPCNAGLASTSCPEGKWPAVTKGEHVYLPVQAAE